jgi:hypothetical protein
MNPFLLLKFILAAKKPGRPQTIETMKRKIKSCICRREGVVKSCSIIPKRAVIGKNKNPIKNDLGGFLDIVP